MLISTKGRYALRVMIDLAQHDPEKYIPLKDVAKRQDISEKYLEIIVKTLVKADFVQGLRGKGGGYRLTKQPSQYTIESILKLTEGTLAPVDCLQGPVNHCPRQDRCKTLTMWENLYKMINDYFKGITLEDLLNNDYQIDDYVI